jgi:enamine deaminase RidA (YjgF/YER057c/UK114 family)
LRSDAATDRVETPERRKVLLVDLYVGGAMRKTVMNPAAGEGIGYAQETGVEPAYAEGVVVHADGYRRVFLSGLTSRDPDLGVGDQTRDALEQVRADLDRVGGSVDDVVRVRVYVAEPNLDQEGFQAIHEARGEFFDREQYPASTLLEVSDLVREGKLVEIDAEAVVPDDGWEVETLE